ncbi:uncharacterized [Tachysurus ichikawai]
MNRNMGLLSESYSSSDRSPASDVTEMMCRNVTLAVMDFSFLKSREQRAELLCELPGEANDCSVIIKLDMRFRIQLEHKEAMEKLMRHRGKHKSTANNSHFNTDLKFLHLSQGFT